MAVSDKKRQANRANAQKSTGPKSKAGKAKVALNSLKHGLRSREVVLPGEDVAAFDQMIASWMDDWQPPTDARRLLIEQAVAHAWRLRRCLKVERDHLIDRGRVAVKNHRRDAGARMEAAVAGLARDPARSLKVLCNEREGVVILLGLWRELAEAATADGWCDIEAHHARLLLLLGFTSDTDADDVGGAVYGSWCLIARNDPESARYAPGLLPVDQCEAEGLAGEVAEFIAEQIADLEEYLGDQFAPPEEHEAKLARLACLDDSPEGRALLRYEGQHGREFRSTLNQLIKLTQTGVDLVVDDEPEAETEAQAISPAEVESVSAPAPNKATEAGPAAPTEATEAEVPAPSKATEAPFEAVPALDRGPDELPRTTAEADPHRSFQPA